MFRRISSGIHGERSRTPNLSISNYDVAVSLGATLLFMAVCAVVVGMFEWFQAQIPQTFFPPAVASSLVSDFAESISLNSMDVVEPTPESAAADASVRNEVDDVTNVAAVADSLVPESLEAIPESSLVPPQEQDGAALIDPNQLPDRADGTGNRPLGTGEGQSSGFHRLRGDHRETRWQIIHSQANSLAEYAARLESIGIQLAAIDQSGRRLVLLNRITDETPELSVGTGEHETRMFLNWGDRTMEQADRDLFQRAGFDATSSSIVHYLSPVAEENLAALEFQAASGKDVRLIRRTEFGIEPTSGGYKFFVIRVLFR